MLSIEQQKRADQIMFWKEVLRKHRNKCIHLTEALKQNHFF